MGVEGWELVATCTKDIAMPVDSGQSQWNPEKLPPDSATRRSGALGTCGKTNQDKSKG